MMYKQDEQLGQQHPPKPPARVLLLWQYYTPERLGKALVVRGMAFVKCLKNRSHEVAVCAPFHSDVPSIVGETDESVLREVTYETLRDWFPVALAVLVFPLAIIGLALRLRRFNPDVIIVSQPSYTLPFQGYLLARLLGAAFVVDIQDVFLQEQVFLQSRRWRGIKIWLERFVASHLDFAFVVLPKMRDELVQRYGMERHKAEILYNGFDSDRFPVMRPGSVGKGFDLVHLGAPRVYYDTVRLVEGLSKICMKRQATRLVFTDCREDDYLRRVKSKVQQLGLTQNVEFRGQLEREHLLGLLKCARLGVYTLYPEESSKVIVGTKIFEYLAVGLPVVHLGHPGGSVDDILKETNAGIVAHDAELFAQEVVRLLEDPRKLDELSRNAMAARNRFDWNRSMPPAIDRMLRACDSRR